MVILGLVGASAGESDELSRHVCGESEIDPSIGCGIRNDEVFVLFRDKFIFRGSCDTSDPTVITMVMDKGKLSFQVDNKNVDCSELKTMKMDGSYHIAVSTDKEGQAARIMSVDVGSSKASGNAASNITFRDSFRSTNVDGHVIRCGINHRATNITDQLMTTDGLRVTVKVKVERRAGGIVCLGVVGEKAKRDELGDHICGEKEIDPSLGCGIHDDEVFIVLRDNIIFRGTCNTSDPTYITMVMENGRLTFKIDNKEVGCDVLKATKLQGAFHIGVSTTTNGQVVRLESVNVEKSNGNGSHIDSTKLIGGSSGFGNIPAPFMLTEGKEFTLEVPKTGLAMLQGKTAVSRAPGDIVLTKEHVKVGKYPTVTCDMCGVGSRSREDGDPEPLLENRWKCSVCDDYDVCNSCFSQDNWKHDHERRKFRVYPGGSFFECRMSVETNGEPFVLAAVEAANESRFPCGVQAEFTVTPKAHGTIAVAIRILKEKAVFLADNRILGSTDLPEAPAYRFGVRLCGASQRVTLLPRVHVPMRGSEIQVTTNAATLEAETGALPKGTRLKTDSSMAGKKGHILHTDEDGTLKAQMADGRVLWLPIGAVKMLKPPMPPVFGIPKKGMKIVRNPLCWKWGNQDGRTPGEVIEDIKDGWLRVRWQNGDTNSYRFGKDAKYDIVPYPAEGSVVVRNPSFWRSGNDDGGAGTPGRVVGCDGFSVHVRWQGKSSPTKHRFNIMEHEVWLAPPNTTIAGASAPKVPFGAGATVDPTPSHGATVNPVPSPVLMSKVSPSKVGRLSDTWEADVTATYPGPVKGVATAQLMSLSDAIDHDSELAKADLSSVAFIATIAVQDKYGDRLPFGLTLDEAASIHAYTQESDLYHIQGTALRSARRERLRSMFPLLRLQFGALAKLPRPESVLTVYRGIRDDVHTNFPVNATRVWWGMTSTTRSIEVMEAFAKNGGTLFVIEAYDLVGIETLSALPVEEEHILFPGTTMKVKAVINTGFYWMVQLVQISTPKMVDMLPPHPKLVEAGKVAA